MRSCGVARTVLCLAAFGVLWAAPSQVGAQPAAAGVVVDAQGVLQKRVYADPGGQLMRERIASARAALDPKLAAPSRLRKISLARLEQAVRQRQGVPTHEMRYLAGLLRLQYVFLYPDSGDVVIAGPAEGWATNPAGRVVGITSGRPVIQLEDLVVALRVFPPGASGTPLIGCSIDPTTEGKVALQRFAAEMQQYINNTRAQPTEQLCEYVRQGIEKSLGLQDVTINGVSPKTRFAQVMVEADYRMKLIGIGLEQPPIRLASYAEIARPTSGGANQLQRWFFVPDYECVQVAEDGLAMHLVGDGVKLIGEGEVVSPDGRRSPSGRTSRASQLFVQGFTRKYPELAARSPVYAELRNLIDLVVATAFMQKEDYYGKAGWRMEFFGDERKFTVETYNIPKRVQSPANALMKGGRLMTPIGGGVSIQPRTALSADNLLEDENGRVAQTREQVKIELAEGRWWWD